MTVIFKSLPLTFLMCFYVIDAFFIRLIDFSGLQYPGPIDDYNNNIMIQKCCQIYVYNY